MMILWKNQSFKEKSENKPVFTVQKDAGRLHSWLLDHRFSIKLVQFVRRQFMMEKYLIKREENLS